MQNNTSKGKKGLLLSAVLRFVLGLGLLGLFLFLCAGSLRYWNAWLFLAALGLPMLVMGGYLYVKDPELLASRLRSREKEKAQGAYTALASLALVLAFVLCGLDYRFGWSHIPVPVVVLALALFLAGFGLFWATLIQNRYASRIIEIQSGQRVIDTGVYAVVRHPLYTASILMFLSAPVALGSWVAALPILLYIAGIIKRIANEEEVLRRDLPGYAAYTQKVRYRLVPFLW